MTENILVDAHDQINSLQTIAYICTLSINVKTRLKLWPIIQRGNNYSGKIKLGI